MYQTSIFSYQNFRALQLSHPFRNFILKIYLTQTRLDMLLAFDSLVPTLHPLLMHLPKPPWPMKSLSLLSALFAYPWSSKAMFHMWSSPLLEWIYLRSWETWKTLWRLERDGGNTIWPAHLIDDSRNWHALWQVSLKSKLNRILNWVYL